MADYKGRRERKRASGGMAGEGPKGSPHGHMLILIGLPAKPKKKKAGGTVEGKAARKHLGKRARGGPSMSDKDMDNYNEFMQENRRQDALDGQRATSPTRGAGPGKSSQPAMGTYSDYRQPMERTDTAKGWMNFQNDRAQAQRDEDFRMDNGGVGRAADAENARNRGGRTKRAKGGASEGYADAKNRDMRSRDPDYRSDVDSGLGPAAGTNMEKGIRDGEMGKRGGHIRRADGGRFLDARDDAESPMVDGPDKVSEGRGTKERGAEQTDARFSGGPAPSYARGGYESDTRKSGGRLTAKERHDLPNGDFALPGGRYPIPDPSHGRNALARVSQFGSPEEKAKVRSAVHRKFPGIGED